MRVPKLGAGLLMGGLVVAMLMARGAGMPPVVTQHWGALILWGSPKPPLTFQGAPRPALGRWHQVGGVLGSHREGCFLTRPSD